MKAVVYPICAFLSLGAMFWWIHRQRRDGEPALSTVVVCLGLGGVTFGTSTPAVAGWLSDVLGVPNVGSFVMHFSAVALSFAIQVHVINWAHESEAARPRIRTRLVLLAVVTVAMVGLFLASSQPAPPGTYLLTGAERGGTLFVLYLFVYLGALGLGWGTSTWMSWRYARVCTNPWLRRAMRVSAVGFAMTLIYVVIRAATLVNARLGGDPGLLETFVPVFTGLSLLITLAGLSLTFTGPRLSAAGAWLRRWRDLRRLEPLWRALYDAVPGIALDPPSGRRVVPRLPRQVGMQLLRRVIEISDGRLAVAPYVPATVETDARERGRAAGLSGEELEASVEAARIAAGLAAMERRVPAGRAGASAVPPPGGAGGQADDLAGEVARLVRVTRAFTGCPVVAGFRS